MENFAKPQERFSVMVEKFKAMPPQWLNFFESEIREDSREVNRELLRACVNNMGIGDIGASLKMVGGRELTHRRVMSTTLRTRYGAISVRRMGYSHRGHEVIYPLDVVLNLPRCSSYSFELQRFIARRISTTAFEEVLELTKEVTGVTVGKRQALKIVEQSVSDFDEFYERQQNRADSSAPIMVLTTDGKGIVMRTEGLREGTREQAEKSSKKMRTRLARGEKTNRKRMAQVASIYNIERFKRTPTEVINEFARREAANRRPRPSNKRVWASVEKDSDDVIEEMFEEASKRDPKHKKEWVILIDGNKHQMRLVKSFSKQKGVKPDIVIDIIHVIEYLWNAARLFYKETSKECEQWVEEMLEMLLNSQAGKVAGSIRMSAAKRKLTDEQKKTAKTCADYIAHRKQYMDYARCLKEGYPIATGVIEGACRYLIKDRMDITGARWSLNGAEAILKLRSLVTSRDFDAYWQFHLQGEHYRNHVSKLANLEQLSPIFKPTSPS